MGKTLVEGHRQVNPAGFRSPLQQLCAIRCLPCYRPRRLALVAEATRSVPPVLHGLNEGIDMSVPTSTLKHISIKTRRLRRQMDLNQQPFRGEGWCPPGLGKLIQS
ncbi:unnamed protein product [Protopolystoma xenopodis]|uniref:Uncharacterized protein n=1 Tax=Protopolystoma xenopodis TaxID=117903 RepID=A0A3S5CMU8_9PLAT|nr:unnamed protein product [Protopolystoma xenopodis]